MYKLCEANVIKTHWAELDHVISDIKTQGLVEYQSKQECLIA